MRSEFLTMYEQHGELSQRSTEVVLPLVLEDARTVADVGCGGGWWAKVAMSKGADVLGIDGDWAEPQIPFHAHDLSYPLRLRRRFDLVLCLEVAQYLPPERADSFVADLTALSDRV